MQLMVTERGEEHGLINTLANSCADKGFGHMAPEDQKKAEAMRKEENKVVKARYINHQGTHERLTKPYMRWAGDPIRIFHLIPNETYDLPYGFIKEINDPKKAMPVRSEILDSRGVPTTKDGKGKRIHELVPIGF